MVKLITLTATCVALLAISPAGRADAQDSNLRDRAKQLTIEGRAHQDNREWDAAAAKYRAAYDLVPHPTLLFNLAQVHRLGGKKATALQLYRKFAAVSGDGELATDAKKYIKALEAELGEIPFEDPLKSKDSAKPDPDPTPDPDPDAAPDPDVGPDENAISTTRQRGDRGSGTLRVAGMAVAGVGALLVGGGVYFGLRAKSLSDELSEVRMDAWTQAELDKDRDGRAANRNMLVLSIAGGAAVATGAVLYVLGRSGGSDDSPTAAIGPTDASGGLSVSVSGRF